MTQLLRDVIHVLTRPHIEPNGDRIGYAEPLLDTLRGLIPPSTQQKDPDSGGGSGSGDAGRPPLSVDALVLWEEIAGRIDKEWPYAGHPSTVRVPTTQKLIAWYNNAAQPHEALYLYELCIKWQGQILQALEPVKTMALSGACPNEQCNKTHVETLDEDGIAVYNPALIAYPSAQPIFAKCQVCETRWEGSALHELAERITP